MSGKSGDALLDAIEELNDDEKEKLLEEAGAGDPDLEADAKTPEGEPPEPAKLELDRECLITTYGIKIPTAYVELLKNTRDSAGTNMAAELVDRIHFISPGLKPRFNLETVVYDVAPDQDGGGEQSEIAKAVRLAIVETIELALLRKDGTKFLEKNKTESVVGSW